MQLQALPPDGTCPKCGDHLVQRPDDRESIIRHRVAVYLEQTAPVLEHYGRRGLVHRVDGDRPVEEIRADLLHAPAAHPPVLVAS